MSYAKSFWLEGRPETERFPRAAVRTGSALARFGGAALLALTVALAGGASLESLSRGRLDRESLAAAATLASLAGAGGLYYAQRRRAEEAARSLAKSRLANRESTAYRLTFEHAEVAIAHIGTDGRFLRANQRFCNMFGYTRAELRGLEKWQLVHPDDRKHLEEDFETVVAARMRKYSRERRYVAKDGRIVPVASTATFVNGANESSSFLALVVEDLSARKAAEDALRESEERFRLAMKGANEGLWDWDIAAGTTYLSPRWKSMLGYEDDEIANTPDSWRPLLAPGVEETLSRQLEALESGETTTYEVEIRLRHKQGRWVDVLSRAFPVLDENRRMVRLVGTHQDISERKRQEADLRRAAAVFENTHEGVIITDADGFILTVNPAFKAITGYTEDEARGKPMSLLRSGRHTEEFYGEIWRAMQGEGHWQGEIWNRRKDGTLYPEWRTISSVRNAAGVRTNYVATFTDISQLKQSEARLEFLAHHDPLTQLPNRYLLRDRIAASVEASRKDGGTRAVLFLDIDRFKTVNDSLGHAVGDELLLIAADRWSRKLRPSDLLARVGGDEFVVMLEPSSMSFAAEVAEQLIAEASKPFHFADGREIYVGLSVGVALFPSEVDGADALLQQADSALCAAKASGGGVRFYSPGLTEAAREQLDMEAGLRRAMERGDLDLQFQPLVSLADRGVFGVEALVRWRSPTGVIPPGQFIPMAERTGLIVPLGEWVLREACTRMKRWLDAGYPLHTLAVNLSPRQFELPDICGRIRAILDETGLPPSRLEIEITESALMQQGRHATRKLMELKALGLRIAVDDFGTGHSSLAYLKHFPIDKLKLDRSFIADIPGDSTSMEIAAAIIRLGQSLKLDVLAEGVETEAQAYFLAQSGCPNAQGFLFERPLWEADLLQRLKPEAMRLSA